MEVGGDTVSSIGPGLLVFLGVAADDGPREADYLAARVAALRVFEDREGRMNLSLRDTGGEALVVSQFTLVADTARGNRPGFSGAAPPQEAEGIYQRFLESLKGEGIKTGSGVFRAQMIVSLANDGPVTIMLESK